MVPKPAGTCSGGQWEVYALVFLSFSRCARAFKKFPKGFYAGTFAGFAAANEESAGRFFEELAEVCKANM